MVNIEKIKSIAKEVCKFCGVDLVEVKYKHIPGRSRLEVYIDKFGGVSVEDCKKVSERMSFYLDVDTDIIKGSFNLIVSSPGVYRPLKTVSDFFRKRGREIELYLKDGTTITGKIKGVDGDVLLMEDSKGIRKISWKEIREGKQKVLIK